MAIKLGINKKELIIAVATAIIGILFWWLLKLYFFGGSVSICILAGVLVLFLAFCAIFSFLISSSKIISFFPTILAAGFLAFFGLNKIIGAALIIFGFLFVIGVNAVRFYQRQILQIKIWRLSQKILSKIFLGIAVLVAVVFYLSPNSVILKNEQFKIPELFYNQTIKLSEPIIENFLPGFSFDMPVQNFYALMALRSVTESVRSDSLSSEVLKELQKQSIDSKNSLNKETFNQIIQGGIVQNKDVLEKDISYLSKSFGVKILPDESVSSALYKIANSKISAFFKEKPERKEVFKSVLAFGLFLSLIGLRFLFIFVSRILTVGIFAILKKNGFVKIEIEKADKEIITI